MLRNQVEQAIKQEPTKRSIAYSERQVELLIELAQKTALEFYRSPIYVEFSDLKGFGSALGAFVIPAPAFKHEPLIEALVETYADASEAQISENQRALKLAVTLDEKVDALPLVEPEWF